ncbi:MAG: diguanylate cyclase [Sulfuritalea sp.]|nr:diguanylate cyclase [Sulfuritalea sp.]
MTGEKTHSELDFIGRTRLEEIKAMEAYPLPRGAALALVRLSQRESTSLAVLAHAIKADPAFSVQVIKVANGVGGADHGPVISLRDAVNVLGVPAVRALATGLSLLANYRSGPCRNFDYPRYWSQALVRALTLQLLAPACDGCPPAEAFSAGLLARSGELVLATLFPQQYSDLLQRRYAAPDARLADLETEAFAITHATIAASVMQDCGLPVVYIAAVDGFDLPESQAYPEGSGSYNANNMLALADVVADICVAPPSEWRALMPRLFQLGARLSLKGEALIAQCDRIAHEWREWGALLGVETGPAPHFEESSELRQPAPAPLAPAAPAIAGTSTDRMCILVVGDQARVRNPLCGVLTAAGHQVFEAADGRQGLAMAVELQPQIMLVDAQAAELDGLELTRTLRQFKAGRSIYVMVLAARDDDAELVRAFDAGADDFLCLPAPPPVLAARLRAGQRVAWLQEELARDQEEIRRISAELSVSNQQLQDVGMTDLLTGCPNRRYAMDRIQQEWAMATRSQRPLSCMVIDIDNLKQVNDAHGHVAGDMVLKLVASAFKDEMRAQDVLARSGGDEFLVICPDTTLQAAMACAERMRAAVESLPIVGGAQAVRGSVSIGVAVRDASVADPDALIRLADQGAYLAKRSRNTVATVQSYPVLSLRPV